MKLDGEQMRWARERLGYSMETVGEEAGVSKNSVLRAEHGEDIRPITARKIANALGISVADLMEETQPPKVPAQLSLSIEQASAAPPQFSELPGLEAARERRGVTRRELATRSGVPVTEIEGLENGSRRPDPDTVNLLASALDAFRAELTLPPEQAEEFLEGDQRQNEQIRRDLEKLDASDMRALMLRELLSSPASRQLREAIREGSERRSRNQREVS